MEWYYKKRHGDRSKDRRSTRRGERGDRKLKAPTPNMEKAEEEDSAQTRTLGLGLPDTLQTNVASDPSINWKLFNFCSNLGGQHCINGTVSSNASESLTAGMTGRYLPSRSSISFTKRFSNADTWKGCNSTKTHVRRFSNADTWKGCNNSKTHVIVRAS